MSPRERPVASANGPGTWYLLATMITGKKLFMENRARAALFVELVVSWTVWSHHLMSDQAQPAILKTVSGEMVTAFELITQGLAFFITLVTLWSARPLKMPRLSRFARVRDPPTRSQPRVPDFWVVSDLEVEQNPCRRIRPTRPDTRRAVRESSSTPFERLSIKGGVGAPGITSVMGNTHLSAPYKRLVVILIRPSKYDDEGYVVRHWRSTLPSNTLSCLNSLTEDVIDSGALGGVEVHLDLLDETVACVGARKFGRRYRRAGTKVVVGLVGVQTNQFPRAQDLARQFRAEGFEVIIGGFHVSGAIAMSSTVPPECQEMLDAGVTLVLGEVEGHWAGILQDALADRLLPTYDYLATPPDLSEMPLPRPPRRALKGSVPTHIGSVDAGRGCPFACSFCSIINVQGRTVRARSAGRILEQIRKNYWRKGRHSIRHYFFTDDNFARNPNWEPILDGLIRLREEEGADIDFMMQVDTQASRIRNFVEKAARAGCVQVFIGMESVRDDNLQAGGKPQNKAADYREMIARWHGVGVVCHVGLIIGFPYDTRERVMEDVRTLSESMLVDQASFFMLTPIPGSRDHQAAVDAGVVLDADYNNYDSFHATSAHPRMSRDEWERTFRDAWTQFYSFEHMRRSLLAQNPHTYWAVLKNLIWYRAAMIEGAHPMITGFFRLKDRRSRRPTFPIERRWPFLKRRARDIAHVLRGYLALFFEMQELWLLTRIRTESRGSHGLQTGSRPSSSFGRRARRANLLSLDRLEHDPALRAYWRQTRRAVARLQLWRLNPLALTWNLARATRQALFFLFAMSGERY